MGRWLRGLVVGAAVVLLTSGCAVVPVAVTATQDTRTAPASVTPAMGTRPGDVVDAAELSRRLVAASRGVDSDHFVMRFSGLTVEGDVSLRGGRFAARETATLHGAHVEMIVIDSRAWVRAPLLTRGRWVTARSGGLDRLSRALQPMFDEVTQLEKGEQVRRQVAGTISRGATRTVGGVLLTEYIAHPSAEDVLDAMPKEEADEIRTREITGISAHVWVDGSFLPRTLTSTVTVSGTQYVTRLDLSRFGQRVTIAPPVPGSTTPLPPLEA